MSFNEMDLNKKTIFRGLHYKRVNTIEFINYISLSYFFFYKDPKFEYNAYSIHSSGFTFKSLEFEPSYLSYLENSTPWLKSLNFLFK